MAGLWFEEFEDGMVFNHEWSRTITETDNIWFSLLTMNVQGWLTRNADQLGGEGQTAASLRQLN